MPLPGLDDLIPFKDPDPPVSNFDTAPIMVADETVLVTTLTINDVIDNIDQITKYISGEDPLNFIPQIAIDNLVTDLAAKEDIANKVITVGTPGDDTNYPSEQAVREALDLKEDSLGFTPEDIANKGMINGYAPLDGSSLVPTANLGSGTANNTTFLRGDQTYVIPPFLRLDGTTAMQDPLMMGGHKITGLGTPTDSSDATTKAYVDMFVQGLVWHEPARLATEVNVALSGLGDVDGITPIAGDRILVKAQNDSEFNGVYAAAAGAWTRTADMNEVGEFEQATFFVMEGTVNEGTAWTQTETVTIVNTSPVMFVEMFASLNLIAGDGLDLMGNILSVVGTAGKISVSAAGVDIDAGYLGQTSITTLGTIATGVWNGTAITYANLNLAGGILNADVNAAAAIEYSKLDLTDSIENADLDGGFYNKITGIGAQTQDLDMNQNEINNIISQSFFLKTTDGQTVIDFNLEQYEEKEITSTITFTTLNLAAGKSKIIKLTNTGSNVTMNFPPGWTFLNLIAPPAALVGGKTAILSLTSYTGNDSDVIAAYASEL